MLPEDSVSDELELSDIGGACDTKLHAGGGTCNGRTEITLEIGCARNGPSNQRGGQKNSEKESGAKLKFACTAVEISA